MSYNVDASGKEQFVVFRRQQSLIVSHMSWRQASLLHASFLFPSSPIQIHGNYSNEFREQHLLHNPVIKMKGFGIVFATSLEMHIQRKCKMCKFEQLLWIVHRTKMTSYGFTDENSSAFAEYHHNYVPLLFTMNSRLLRLISIYRFRERSRTIRTFTPYNHNRKSFLFIFLVHLECL